MSFNCSDETLSTLLFEVQTPGGESINNMVPFQIISEREFVGPPLGTYRQGTMSMRFTVWLSGELIYVGAGEMPRRSANKSGSIHVV